MLARMIMRTISTFLHVATVIYRYRLMRALSSRKKDLVADYDSSRAAMVKQGKEQLGTFRAARIQATAREGELRWVFLGLRSMRVCDV